MSNNPGDLDTHIGECLDIMTSSYSLVDCLPVIVASTFCDIRATSFERFCMGLDEWVGGPEGKPNIVPETGGLGRIAKSAE